MQFVEDIAHTCKHTFLITMPDGIKDLACPSYPNGIPVTAACFNINDCLLDHPPVPPCPNGMHYEVSDKYRKRCEMCREAQQGKRSWEEVYEFMGGVY